MDEEMIRKIKVGRQYRSFEIERQHINQEKRTIDFSFSSEEPVERFWGIEILDHNKKSVNLSRLYIGGSLLVDHDMTKLVGVIEEVSIDETNRKGRGKARFGKKGLADDVFGDVLDGIRSNVSVGYQVDEIILEKEEKGKPSTYRVTKWTPYEISLVSCPADISIGIGRSEEEGKEIEIKIPVKEERKMDKCAKCGVELVDGKCVACETVSQRHIEVMNQPKTPSALELEKDRKRGIENLCKINKIPDNIRDGWISQGLSMTEVSDQLLLVLEERGRANPQSASRIGLNKQETEQFSFSRAILACVENNWRNAPFELECSKEVARRTNKVVEATKFYVPFEVLEREVPVPIHREGRRDLSVGYGGGAYLVETTNIGFIEMLRNRAVVFRMGARRLTGLQGNVTIPKQSGAATAYWLTSETTETTESQPTILQVVMTPKTVAAYTEISRQLLLQSSPGAEGIVSDDLAQVVALAVDYAGIAGPGTAGSPLGIIYTPLVGTQSGAALAYAGVLGFQSALAVANVMPIRGGYVGTPATAILMMTEMKVANTFSPCWEGNLNDGMMCGYPAMSSNQIPTAGLLFGDFSELCVGEWGVLEVEVNPFANFKAGIFGVRALYSMDVAVRRPVAFCWSVTVT